MRAMKVIKKFNPHLIFKGINKMNLFEKIIGHILWCTIEYTIGFQEKFSKMVRRDRHSLEYISDPFKTQEMCNKTVEPYLLKFVPACFRMHCFKVVEKKKGSKSNHKRRVDVRYLAPIKVVGLVCLQQ